MHVVAHPYTGHVLEKIDTPEDLERVSTMIREKDFADQPVFELTEDGAHLVAGSPAGRVTTLPSLGKVLDDCGLTRPLVVADSFLSRETLESLLGGGSWPVYSDYKPNPSYEQVLDAIRAYRAGRCDSVVSVGGGSAIDVAKCVKLWSTLPGDGSGRDDDNPRYCDVPVGFNTVRHAAIPTTAGTGSESTHFAVVYVDGEKRSISFSCLQPDVALLVPDLLAGLPAVQRKATMLDALCQAIESHWSATSSPKSRVYSSRAIPMVMGCWEAYLAGEPEAARAMHRAANLAGKAINLTTTTLAHAMSYKLTSFYGIPHGHAVAMCMPFAWRTLLERGDEIAQERLHEIDTLMCGKEAPHGAGLDAFLQVLSTAGPAKLPQASEGDFDILATSVNPQRMGNYPVKLTTDELRQAYQEILLG